ncbi:hypothetical protein GCM10025768_05100 [Microbacterium pseudoresistens]|uniref:ABC-type multidrug transport system ATPase subunit n=1 Tax=Microbacterium pseudoresistens TaxID=640634 RepID=A0A7Y9EUR9_9MICO|nr:ATP-binding cassette domain-containing protein [Microbacterium pseudoresistens]NYD54347.1 ABC-type multidrug transport system ATPase subunit [Microbacterium pseudoresistens]
MTDGQLLEFSRVTKRFGALTAVDDLTARIAPGAVTAFLGPNGAGKTTSLRMLLGQIRPTEGTATIGGVAYAELKHPLRIVGSVLEEASYRPRRTAIRQLTNAAKANGIPLARVGEVLNLVGLQNETETRIGAFSLGMRQRLSVATALLGDPGALVLDEPANGLDPEGIRWMRLLMRRLADEGRTVLVSSHVLSEIEQIADDVLVLSKGRLVYADSISKLSDPTNGSVIVDADDRDALAHALNDKGLRYDVLRSGLTVHDTSAGEVGALAVTAGIPLTTLLQRGPSLEEVFLDLVHGRRASVTGAADADAEPGTTVLPVAREANADSDAENTVDAPADDRRADEPDEGVADDATTVLPVSAGSATTAAAAGALAAGAALGAGALGASGLGAAGAALRSDADVDEADASDADADAPESSVEETEVSSDEENAESRATEPESAETESSEAQTSEAESSEAEPFESETSESDPVESESSEQSDATEPVDEQSTAEQPLDEEQDEQLGDEGHDAAEHPQSDQVDDERAAEDTSTAAGVALTAPIASDTDFGIPAAQGDDSEPTETQGGAKLQGGTLPNATEAISVAAAAGSVPTFEELLRGARAFIEQDDAHQHAEADPSVAEVFTRPDPQPEETPEPEAVAESDDPHEHQEHDASERVASDAVAGAEAEAEETFTPESETHEPPTETTEIAGIEIFSSLTDGQTQEIQVVLDQPVEDDDHDDVTAGEHPQAAALSASLAAAARAYYDEEAPSYTPGEAAEASETTAPEAAHEGEHSNDGGHDADQHEHGEASDHEDHSHERHHED